MKKITLHAQWLVKAPLAEVFNLMTDFEKFSGVFSESCGVYKDSEARWK